jgi:hypothetical protein
MPDLRLQKTREAYIPDAFRLTREERCERCDFGGMFRETEFGDICESCGYMHMPTWQEHFIAKRF